MDGSRLVMVLLATAGACAAPAVAQNNLTLSERVERLERQAGGAAGGGATADLVIKINQLQQEVRELRGLVEQQQHEIESLKARQRDQYLDLDRRLQERTGGPPAQVPDASAAEEGGAVRGGGGTGERDDISPGRDRDTASGPRPVADEAGRQRAYDAAFTLLRDGRYADAAEGFREFLEQYPDGPLADNAQYWLGESYYVTGNFDIAQNAFQQVLNRFPDSPKVPDAHLKLGFCYYELEQWDQARSTLDEVTQAYPDSAVARLAQNRLRLMRIEGH